ncbi:MAG TPA: hypothetical protein VG737_17435 [Cyclobacteriaceae bacterium]|nr:hypothetical protein [Cyclobacteriaceae bacterium]
MKHKLILVIVLYSLITDSMAQAVDSIRSTERPKKKEIDELRLNLNEDGSHYIKGTLMAQIWLRSTQCNPGSLVIGEPAQNTFDIGLRRVRFQLYGAISDHVNFYFQFGENNFNFLAGQNSTNNGNRKLQAFFHDALGEYRVKRRSDLIILGGGLTITNGLSRWSNPSVSTIMGMDLPNFMMATLDQTDQYDRKLSVYARGQIDRLSYRIMLSDPFPITSNGAPPPVIGSNAQFAIEGHHKQYQGFFMWNFLEQESHTTMFMPGTYLGKKRIFNLEAGFITQKNATETGVTDAVTNIVTQKKFYDLNLYSVALFYDAPLNTEKETALSAYAGYFHTDYGNGYLRYYGVMNPSDGLQPGYPSGSNGNSFPMFGTGSVYYCQAGYLLKKDLFGEGNGTLMPYIQVQSAKYNRLQSEMNVYDLGLNWLIKGNSSKFTLDYQNRPTYLEQGINLISGPRKGQLTLQYQIYF